MHRLSLALAAVLLASALAPVEPAGAQAPTPDPSQVPPLSEALRQAGYTLGEAEAAYLDADQQVQLQYAVPLFQVMSLVGPEPGLPGDGAQASIVAELRTITALDPTAAPQAPASMASLRELVVQHRTALRSAATAWLAGLEAGDPEWAQRGAENFVTAQQTLFAWQQEMMQRFPPPESP